MALERFSAAWREQYVSSTNELTSDGSPDGCVFCTLAQAAVSPSTGVLWRSETTYVALNAFPYGSGHLLVLPRRHVAGLGELTEPEYQEFFGASGFLLEEMAAASPGPVARAAINRLIVQDRSATADALDRAKRRPRASTTSSGRWGM